MGWAQRRTYNKKNTEEVKTFFAEEYPQFTILYLSIKNFREVYIAMQDKEGKVFACVALIENMCDSFSYKIMEENILPYYFNAPKKLIKMLSPTDNTNALEWRERCAKIASVKVGQMFTHDRLGIMKVTKVGTYKVIALATETGALWRVLKVTVLNNLITEVEPESKTKE